MCADLLWNILAFLMIIAFLVDSILALLGWVWSDATSVISYLISEDNIGPDKDSILLKPAKNI